MEIAYGLWVLSYIVRIINIFFLLGCTIYMSAILVFVEHQHTAAQKRHPFIFQVFNPLTRNQSRCDTVMKILERIITNVIYIEECQYFLLVINIMEVACQNIKPICTVFFMNFKIMCIIIQLIDDWVHK